MFTPIPLNDFELRTGIDKSVFQNGYRISGVVSLRDIVKVLEVRIMPVNYLKRLLLNVTLEGNPEEKIYQNCEITTARMDPSHLIIGQTFIQRRKYQAFLEAFHNTLQDYCVTRGIAKCTALIIIGEDKYGTVSVAHYLPPIIEENKGRLCLLDGIHRNFLVMSVGTTLESIIIKKVTTSFPCDLNSWNRVRIVDEKPPREERYFNLRPDLFRDLKIIGIDG